MDNLIREDDRTVYGYRGYESDAKKQAAEAAGVKWCAKDKAKPGRNLTTRQRRRNRRFGKPRAKGEHVFRVLNCHFGYRRVRYHGIAKNGAQVLALLALANRDLARSQLTSDGRGRVRKALSKQPRKRNFQGNGMPTTANAAIQRHYSEFP